MEKIIDLETGCDGRALQMVIDYDAEGVNTLSYSFSPKIPIKTAEKMRPMVLPPPKVHKGYPKNHNKGHVIKV